VTVTVTAQPDAFSSCPAVTDSDGAMAGPGQRPECCPAQPAAQSWRAEAVGRLTGSPAVRLRLRPASGTPGRGTAGPCRLGPTLTTIIFPVFEVQYSRFFMDSIPAFIKMSIVFPLFYSSGNATNISLSIVSQTGNIFQLSRAQHTSLERSRRPHGRDRKNISHASTPKMLKHLVGIGSSSKPKRAR
jgi:hypothetical protein